MKSGDKFILYKPVVNLILVDLLFLIISVILTFLLAPMTTSEPFTKYFEVYSQFFVFWTLVSYILTRYKPLQKQNYYQTGFKLFFTSIILLIIFWFIAVSPSGESYSYRVIIAFTILVFLINFVFITFYFAVKNAVVYYDQDKIFENIQGDEFISEETINEPIPLSDEDLENLKSKLTLTLGKQVYDLIHQNTSLNYDWNYITYGANVFDIDEIKTRMFKNIFIFKNLNYITGINRMMYLINQKIPGNGIFVCCFEQKDVRNFNIKRKFPEEIYKTILFLDYIIHRVFPKIFLTRTLYFKIKNKTNRSLTKSEVMGRLYYNGFEVLAEKKIDSTTYIIAKKVRNSLYRKPAPKYGMLIKLKRVGKNGKRFNVYKFRTMYPYSEFIQAYMFQKYSLQKGGKINKDVRISPTGKFMRKYWIDELPMLFNIFKGDMKIVGVRPLSDHFFSLYHIDLQEKRTRFKPGLLPPFYADMPKTLDEIQESEMRYLTLCEKQGVFRTDMQYLIKILNNILINKARSA